MPIFGIDISHWQGSFDIERAAREGIEFFILKATEGSSFVDGRFKENLAKARKTGKVVAAYHYQRSNVSAADQVALITRTVPKDIPVIPDVEAGSGSVALTRDIVRRLQAAGYTVPLVYIPRWYWQQIGSPSLAGLPPLWSSRYPDNRVGDIRDEYADVPPHFWDGYGGLHVAVLQFTSSARVAGRHPIDANAFRGSIAELRALFGAKGGGGGAAPASPEPSPEQLYHRYQEATVLLPTGKNTLTVHIPQGAKRVVLNCPVGKMAARIQWVGEGYPKTKGKFPNDNKTQLDADWVANDAVLMDIDRMRPWRVNVPSKARSLKLNYTYKPGSILTQLKREKAFASLDFEF